MQDLNKSLIVWNIILSLLVAYLLFMVSNTTKLISDISTHNIVQDTVLCGYIDDIQIQTGIDTTLLPDCRGDIKILEESMN